MIKANNHILERFCWKHELWCNIEGTRIKVFSVFPLNSGILILVFYKITLLTLKNPEWIIWANLILKRSTLMQEWWSQKLFSLVSLSYRILVLIFRLAAKKLKSWPSFPLSSVVTLPQSFLQTFSICVAYRFPKCFSNLRFLSVTTLRKGIIGEVSWFCWMV